ncbi:MAG: sulfatase-like hydrolase/transferase [Acidobacteriota bacterium]
MMLTRRQLASTALAAPFLHTTAKGQSRRPPNVILIMTDDQGYGDLSLHGNQHLKTPHTDRIGKESVQFTQFQVCPVCSPTRSSLLTGRYNYRTGVVDTYLGRSMMWPDEVTIAEMLKPVGYSTGIFGKWHLGDNYPLRSIDQGFDESVVCSGGGLTQPSDPPGNHYQDPMLIVNGKWEKRKGYCTDIFFDETIRFMERHRRDPFFAYVPTNAPHTPLEIADEYWKPFAKMGLDDTTAKIYGMCRNLDDNTGKLLAAMERLDLANDTVLIFLTDNGPQQRRFNVGMRGLKGSVYQGGIRVPFFFRWPGKLKPAKVDRIAAHIDVTPTLAEICGAKLPTGRTIDGKSLMPLLRGESANWGDRTLYTQWHRGEVPELFRACAARSQQYKLVDGKELYDLSADPEEKHDVAGSKPEVVKKMRKGVEDWFRSVAAERNFAPPRIALGAPQQNPVTLTRQDWRGPKAGWDAGSIGHWEVDVARAGKFDLTVRFAKAGAAGAIDVKLGGFSGSQSFAAGAESATIAAAALPKGPGQLAPLVKSGAAETGALYVDVKRLG